MSAALSTISSARACAFSLQKCAFSLQKYWFNIETNDVSLLVPSAPIGVTSTAAQTQESLAGAARAQPYGFCAQRYRQLEGEGAAARWDRLVSDIRKDQLSLKNVRYQQHSDLIEPLKARMEYESFIFFKAKAAHSSSMKPKKQLQPSNDAAKPDDAESKLKIRFDGVKSKSAKKDMAHSRLNILEEFMVNHDKADDVLLCYVRTPGEPSLQQFFDFDTSCAVSRERSKSFDLVKTVPVGENQFTFRRDGSVFWENQKALVGLQREKLAIWSYRHLDSILRSQNAEASFQDLSLEHCYLFESKYNVTGNICHDESPLLFSFPSSLQDTSNQWVVDLKVSMSARKLSNHTLMYSDVELRRQEILWLYEARTGDKLVWRSTSISEAKQLEKIYREECTSQIDSLKRFHFDSTFVSELVDAALENDLFNFKVSRGGGQHYITVSLPGSSKSQRISRFSWEPVQGDVVFQCSQWLYSLETHFQRHLDSYCYVEPKPAQKIAQIWTSLSSFHSKLKFHERCEGDCDPKKHFEFMKTHHCTDMSHALFTVAESSLHQFHLLLGKIEATYYDQFKTPKWTCSSCFHAIPDSNELPPPFENPQDVTPEPSQACSCPVLCRWVLALSSWHQNDKSKKFEPRKLPWMACRVDRLPFPDGFEQIAKLFCSNKELPDNFTWRKMDVPKLLNIFLYCRYFADGRFNRKFDRCRILSVRDCRNFLDHTHSEEHQKVNCKDYEEKISLSYKLLLEVADSEFSLNIRCLHTFLSSCRTDALVALAKHVEYLGVVQEEYIVGKQFSAECDLISMNYIQSVNWVSSEESEVSEHRFSCQLLVYRCFAKELKAIRSRASETAITAANKFSLNKVADGIQAYLHALHEVMDSTSELLLIKQIEERHPVCHL